MLQLIDVHGSIGVSTCHHDWRKDLADISDILLAAFPDPDIRAGFFPHPGEVDIQASLRQVPALRIFSEQLGGTDLKAIIIRSLGLSDFSVHDRNLLLFALSLSLGFPTPTEPRHQRVFWDDRSRPPSRESSRTGEFTTFSERTGRADMHTDSSFIPMPEEHFLLYTVRAARCGGGASCLIDVDDVVSALMDTRAGRMAQIAMTDVWPFDIPSAFASHPPGQPKSAVGLFPIFSAPFGSTSAVNIRWRHDAILRGLAARPELCSPSRLTALSLMHDLIKNNVPCFKHTLDDDSLLWVDNHHMLHGRTDFTDPDRHLIRVRIARQPNAARAGLHGLTSD